ncbi:MAG: hypothetical protein K6F65_03145 [Lachnospiraceae bacterium]|nr:hypothetical protein [Lachnospiraceae bacterium]
MKKNIFRIIMTFAAVSLVCLIYSGKAEAAVKTMPDGGLFDPSFYAATYDDVYKAFGMNETLLYQHYLLCGIKEKRLPYAGYVYAAVPTQTVPASESKTILKMPDGTLFDPEFYVKKYPDVVAVFGTDPMLLYAHYVYYGMAEGRLPYEGYEPSAVKLTFSAIGAIADCYTADDIIKAVRTAAKYRITNLKIYDRWNSGVSAEMLPSLIRGQLGYTGITCGVKSITCTPPLVYGDVKNLIIETDVTLKY